MILGQKHRKGERGQILILCAACLIVLLLFVGLAIDFGLAYVTKASLGKAVDAAVLTAAKNSGLGYATYAPIATSAFYMNYGSSNRDVAGGPAVSVCNGTTCPIDSLGRTLLTVTATSTIKTFFIGLLPTFSTLNVSSSATARFARVEMTLVIDRTGSMKNNDPNNLLPNAITSFVDDFDNLTDSLAMISFANDQTIDFPMQTGNFQTGISNIAKNYASRFQGATFSDGALQLAQTEEAINLNLPTSVVHVVVFFTDGNANTIQTPLTCTAAGNVPSAPAPGGWRIGGTDPPNNTEVGFVTSSVAGACSPINGNPANFCNYSRTCGGTQNDGTTTCCNGQFTSLSGPQTITWAHVNADALNRAIADANAMRATTPATIVYAIGLKGPDGVLDKGFLCQIANDPSTGTGNGPDGYPYCSSYFTYNPNTPQGQMVLASNSSELTAAFQQIASDIRLRLMQ
jgi:Flp pilus assembly protein TadG